VGNREAFIGYYVPRGEPKDEQYVPEDAPNSGEAVANGDRIPLVEVRSQLSENQKISLVGVQIEHGHRVLNSGSYEVKRKLPDSRDSEYEKVDHVDITEGSTEPAPIEAPESGFGPGGYERITAEVDGIGSEQEVEVVVTVTLKGAENTGISAKLFGDTREFTITGVESTNSDPVVDFKGNSGNAKLETVESELSARVWYRDGSDTLDQKEADLPAGQIRNVLFNGSSRSDKKIVAVSLFESNRTYIRSSDNLNPGDIECYTGIPESEDKFNSETLSPCE